MSSSQKKSAGKSKIHPRNKHQNKYNFDQLVKSNPELKKFVFTNKFYTQTIDFADPKAVVALNKSLLSFYYGLKNWNIPTNYLCPPIPSRADYIHHIADLLAGSNSGVIPKGEKVKCFDIGVGASCIYPIIGVMEYGWSFIGSDIDTTSLASSKKIIDTNSSLKSKIELRLQKEASNTIFGVFGKKEVVDVMICNPPFHSSKDEATSASSQKVSNLTGKTQKEVTLNFGGNANELWCNGGERKFIKEYIRQSKKFGTNCFWFSTLVSKKENLNNVYNTLKNANVVKVKTIEMGQGNKISRIVAWTFLTAEQQKEWRINKWGKL